MPNARRPFRTGTDILHHIRLSAGTVSEIYTAHAVVSICRSATLHEANIESCNRMRAIGLKAALMAAALAAGSALRQARWPRAGGTSSHRQGDRNLCEQAEGRCRKRPWIKQSPREPRALVNGPGSQVLGNPQGDVTVIEFFDYTCPFCKAAEPRLQQLIKDDKNVKLVVIGFPICCRVRSLPPRRPSLRYERASMRLSITRCWVFAGNSPSRRSRRGERCGARCRALAQGHGRARDR